MKTVFILFQTDLHKSKQSRVLCGVFTTKNKAIDHAKKNNLYHHTAEVVVIEAELDKFEEL